MQKAIKVKGMHCKSCEMLIKDSLNDINVESDISFKKGIVKVNFDESKTQLEKIHEIIKDEGYEVII